MHKYTTAGRRPVNAESMRDAAEVFALREARTLFGRWAYVRLLNCNGQSFDGRVAEWQAFVGYRTGAGETTGRNVHLTVTLRG
jgi:hypothetical protein